MRWRGTVKCFQIYYISRLDAESFLRDGCVISTCLFHGRCSSTPTQVQLSRDELSPPLVPSLSPHGTPGEAPLVRGLMLQLGETLSVWSRLAAAGALAAAGRSSGIFPWGFATKESLTSGEEAFALSTAHVGLLRALLAREGWSAPLADCLREVRGREGGREGARAKAAGR